MSRKNTEKTREEIVDKWSGVLREGLPYAIAVEKMMNLLEPYEIQVITGESASQISRARRDDAKIKLSSLQKLYDFYQEVSKMPAPGGSDTVMIPTYNQDDVKELINAGKELSENIKAAITKYNRNLMLNLRSIRDTAPEEKRSLSEYQAQYRENAIKAEQKEQKEAVQDKVEIKSKPAKNAKDEDITLLTDDGKNYFIAPQKYDLTDMQAVLRYTGKFAKDYQYLTLRERYLLEFYTLVHRESLYDEEGEMLQRALDDPKAFWTLHAKYGSEDNAFLRRRYGKEALNQTRLTTPLFNTVNDVKSWVARLDRYFDQHKAEIKDKYADHSLENLEEQYAIKVED